MSARPIFRLATLAASILFGAFAHAQDAGNASSAAQREAGDPRVSTSTSAQREAGEPRVNTSTAAQRETGANTATPAPASDTPTASRGTGKPAAATKAGKDAKATGVESPKIAPKGKKNAADRLDLNATTITGNRELPKVMYIVPWKRADIGDLIGRPANSLLDEVLAPVDRDVFRREVGYYQALNPDSSAANPAAGQPR